MLQIFVVASLYAKNRFPLFRTMLRPVVVIADHPVTIGLITTHHNTRSAGERS